MLILILYNFTGFFTVDLYIVNWFVLKSDDCPYGHVINVYCHLCACLCLQGLFPNLWYACTRYMEGNKLNWTELNWCWYMNRLHSTFRWPPRVSLHSFTFPLYLPLTKLWPVLSLTTHNRQFVIPSKRLTLLSNVQD